jgi:competence protein ComFB
MPKRRVFENDLSEITNLHEELVIELMDEILNKDDTICRCQLCVEDIYALSLNALKPLYVQSTFKERTFKDYNLTGVLDKKKVKAAIRDAAGKVGKNPHH